MTFAQAHECALQYASRWLIEEFHKALKTGLGVERLQLETAERLLAAALMSVVALRLVGLREQVRTVPQAIQATPTMVAAAGNNQRGPKRSSSPPIHGALAASTSWLTE